MSTVADAIVGHLRAAGVRTIFGVPGGGSSLDLIEAARRIDLRFVLTATETAGAIAAIAQSEITGAPGACLAGLGPGTTAVVNGVACAWLDRAPLLVITDAHPASADGCTHQRIDQRALLSPITKWSAILTAESVDATMTEAIDRATTCPHGPVHVECPADVAGQLTVDSSQLIAGGMPAAVAAPCELSTVNCRLFRKPLLIAGLGARRHAAAVRALSASHNLPVMVTYKAKGVVPDRDVRFAGVFTNGALEQDVIAGADSIIIVGLDRVELLPRPWAPRQPIVEIDGDIDARLRELASDLKYSAWDQDALGETIVSQRERLQLPSDALTPDAVVRIASAALTDARVTVDAGAHMFPATLLWPVAEPNGMLISNGLSTMGFAVPAAMGAALVDGERPVVALTGDGGLLMCAGELLTIGRERLRVIVIVFNDRALTLIDVKQRHRRLAREGVALGDVRWRGVANGMGLTAYEARSQHELEHALVSAVASGGPALVDVAVDAASYETILKTVRG